MPSVDLPIELLRTILDKAVAQHSHPVDTGKHLSLVSRRPWRDLGQAIVWKGTPHASLTPTLLSHLASYPHLGRFVRYLTLRGGFGWDVNLDPERVIELCTGLQHVKLMLAAELTTRLIDALVDAECTTSIQQFTLVPSGSYWHDFDLEQFLRTVSRMVNLQTLYIRVALLELPDASLHDLSFPPTTPKLQVTSLSFAERGPGASNWQLFRPLASLLQPSSLRSLQLESPSSSNSFLFPFLSQCISLERLSIIPTDTTIAALLPSFSQILLHLHFLRHLKLPHGASTFCADIDAPSMEEFVVFLESLGPMLESLEVEGLRSPKEAWTVLTGFLEKRREEAPLEQFRLLDIRLEKRRVTKEERQNDDAFEWVRVFSPDPFFDLGY
ncbi:hypothetical protein JCM1841_004124 [Sporobolomyces salmonicolor]